MANEARGKWEMLKAVAALLGAVLIPVVIAYVGNAHNAAIKEQELRAHYVEIAVSILMEEATEETGSVRQWAIDVINSYSEIPMTEETRRYLLSKELPIHPGRLAGAGGLTLDLEEALRARTDTDPELYRRARSVLNELRRIEGD
jgi:hypothetical protein